MCEYQVCALGNTLIQSTNNPHACLELAAKIMTTSIEALCTYFET